MALALFAAFGYLRYATEFYRSAGSIIIKDDKTSSGENKIDLLMQSEGKKNVQIEIEVLQSRPVMERVVKALNLNYTYTAIGKIKELDKYGSVPFKIETLQINDSNSVFELPIHFVSQQGFQINKTNPIIGVNEAFTTRHGKFKLVRTAKTDVGEDYKINWYPTADRANALLGG